MMFIFKRCCTNKVEKHFPSCHAHWMDDSYKHEMKCMIVVIDVKTRKQYPSHSYIAAEAHFNDSSYLS